MLEDSQTRQGRRESAERLSGHKHLSRLGVRPSLFLDEARILQCDVFDDGVDGVGEGFHARRVDVNAR